MDVVNINGSFFIMKDNNFFRSVYDFRTGEKSVSFVEYIDLANCFQSEQSARYTMEMLNNDL
jgi:hypothetical protein